MCTVAEWVYHHHKKTIMDLAEIVQQLNNDLALASQKNAQDILALKEQIKTLVNPQPINRDFNIGDECYFHDSEALGGVYIYCGVDNEHYHVFCKRDHGGVVYYENLKGWHKIKHED